MYKSANGFVYILTLIGSKRKLFYINL